MYHPTFNYYPLTDVVIDPPASNFNEMLIYRIKINKSGGVETPLLKCYFVIFSQKQKKSF